MTHLKFSIDAKYGGASLDYPNMEPNKYGIIAYSSDGNYEHLEIEKEEYEEFKVRVDAYWKEFFKKYPNATI